MAMTQTQAQVARLVARVIVQAVSESGRRGLPSGHLYATLSSHGCTIDQYNSFIESLVGLGILKEEDHVLTMGDEKLAIQAGLL